MPPTSATLADEKYLAFKRLVEGVADRYQQKAKGRHVPRFPFNVQVAVCEQSAGGAWVHFADT